MVACFHCEVGCVVFLLDVFGDSSLSLSLCVSLSEIRDSYVQGVLFPETWSNKS